ncbi:hypothetical protein [Methylocucumis oryzae]|uniref:Uncharacterized protein n=1 Tax=Methylocucumis oryzae TaxID=1632867 RepID=A0A0F3IMU6_9GAMM|nr:hypothetical protein [Methylocucumis oryzae]KJV08017.1 hypothetical protein VZ94_00965 [Methylocucumis oryzae]
MQKQNNTTALERDKLFLCQNGGRKHLGNLEQFSDVVSRFTHDGLNEFDAQVEAKKVMDSELIKKTNGNSIPR